MTSLTLNPTTPVFSPLEPIFAPYTGQIPFAFQEQFLHSGDYAYDILLRGKMHTIWHRPGWLKPLFWTLGKVGILVPFVDQNIPTTLKVVPGFDADGTIYHRWERTLQFDPPINFNTTIIYNAHRQQVVDLVGPKDILYMVWQAKFHPPQTFTLDTEACAFRLGKRLVWMPSWMWRWLLGVVTFSQWVDDKKEDTVHIDLLITHPLFGKIFGYTGSFEVTRIPAKEDNRL